MILPGIQTGEWGKVRSCGAVKLYREIRRRCLPAPDGTPEVAPQQSRTAAIKAIKAGTRSFQVIGEESYPYVWKPGHFSAQKSLPKSQVGG